MLMLNALIVALVAISSVWVYLDATKHKIGKVAGLKSLFNMSAGAWAIVTLLLWIIGFPAYILKRKSLIKLASSHPVEIGGRGIKTAILSIVGGVWFLAAAANALTGYENETGNLHPNGKNWFDAVTSAVPSSDWMFSEKTSGIDGKTLIATRAYQFSSQNTQLEVEITCQPGKKSTFGDLAAGNLVGTSRLSIKSFVGDTANPSESSALVSETNFVRQNDYSNPAELNYPTSRIRIGENIYTGPMAAMVLRMGDYSNEAIFTGLLNLGESIPMAVELKNGAGTFEIEIDRSDEVERVLAACGQDQASLAKAKAEQERVAQRAKEVAEGQALLSDRDNLVSEMGLSCRSVGDLSKFDISGYETVFNRLTPELKKTVKLDCNESAPEQLQAFRVEFENEYAIHATYLTSGGNSRRMPHCSAKDFLAYVHSIKGIENLRSHSDDCEEWKRYGSTTGPSVADLASAASDGRDSMTDYQADYERSRDAAIEDARNAISGAPIAPKPED